MQQEQGSGRRVAAGKRNGQGAEQRTGHWMKQLIASALLFLLVFAGSGLIPDRVADVTGRIRSAITQDVDFGAAFQNLGEALAAGAPVTRAVEDWCTAVFYPESVVIWTPVTYGGSQGAQEELAFLAGWDGSSGALHRHTLGQIEAEEAPAEPTLAPMRTGR